MQTNFKPLSKMTIGRWTHPFFLVLILAMAFGGAGTGVPPLAWAENTSGTCLNHTDSEGQCKDCCDCLEDATARKACRDACIANVSIDQATADDAQMKTIAFDGLAFLTGDICSDTFFPPGKVSDFFGFQYMRDIAPNGFGHNTEFAGRIADCVLSILTDDQVQALVDLANTQGEQVNAYGYKRFVLIKAFRRLLENDLPDGATGLDLVAVQDFSGDLYEIDGEISYERAKTLGNIVTQMTDTQKTALISLKTELDTLFEAAGEGGTIATEDWPESYAVDVSGLNDDDARVLVSTYATQLYSWYLGSVEGDTYFCPERHGTYFGSFYMKDIPALSATEAVTIDANLTATMGTEFLDSLDDTQEALITGLVEDQRTALNNIVAKRQEIAEALRQLMDGVAVSEDEVLALVREYGGYDGEIVYDYATRFAQVGALLTDAQSDTLTSIREAYYESFPDYQTDATVYDCQGAWLYSDAIEMPEIMNTDFLFNGDTNTAATNEGVTDTDATLQSRVTGLSFAEGPAADAQGNVYFSDITANRVYRLSTNGDVSVFSDQLSGPNGLYVDDEGNLLVCEGGKGRLVSLDSGGNPTVLADTYNGASFNEPNDLWVDPQGGVYFSDPIYLRSTFSQDGEHVYYLSPDHKTVTRVISDMTRPNGLVGTPDGQTFYVADHGAGQTYVYDINADGSLTGKILFVSGGSDGMTIDDEGNVYLTQTNVLVYNTLGTLIETIEMPETPTNLCFGGDDMSTLFITTQTALYSIEMNVHGISQSKSNILPDIKANDADGPLTISPDERLTIAVSLDCGNRQGLDADWWILVDTAFGWCYLDVSGGAPTWRYGLAPTWQKALANTSAYEILNATEIPKGSYTFYFALDTVMNGGISASEPVYYDAVQVDVE